MQRSVGEMNLWSKIVQQDRVVASLRRTLQTERVAHAYLFAGPDGVGKNAVALAFAQALQCETEHADPCGACTACRKVQRMMHPDVQVLLPLPSDVESHQAGERIRLLADHVYATIDYVRRASVEDPGRASNKQAFYSVGRISSELRRSMSLKPVEGRYKVALLTDADLMRQEASNAFLKLLEEPGPQTVFILTTTRVDRLLPTILSRCQRLRFDLLDASAIRDALIKNESVDAARADMLSRMADGSYSRALLLLENEELQTTRELVLDFFRLAYARPVGKLSSLIEEISRLGREQVKGVLRLMLQWVRDLIRYRYSGEEGAIINVDQVETIERFCTNLPRADTEAMVRYLEEAIALIERNVHIGLLLRVLAGSIGQAMRGTGPESLYVPLTETG